MMILRPTDERPVTRLRKYKIKNKKQILENRRKLVDAYKLSMGCQLCGYNKHPSALCFDHLSTKHDACRSGSRPGGMYQLYNSKYDISILLEEIIKCRILCHNCHMEETYIKNVTDIHLLIDNLEQLERDLREFENENHSSNG